MVRPSGSVSSPMVAVGRVRGLLPSSEASEADVVDAITAALAVGWNPRRPLNAAWDAGDGRLSDTHADPSDVGHHRDPLWLAARNSRPLAVRTLLDAGVPVVGGDGCRAGGATTPLHGAAIGADPETTRVLLAAGADPQARSHDGLTVLHALVVGPSGDSGPAVADLLLAAGADPAATAPLRAGGPGFDLCVSAMLEGSTWMVDWTFRHVAPVFAGMRTRTLQTIPGILLGMDPGTDRSGPPWDAVRLLAWTARAACAGRGIQHVGTSEPDPVVPPDLVPRAAAMAAANMAEPWAMRLLAMVGASCPSGGD